MVRRSKRRQRQTGGAEGIEKDSILFEKGTEAEEKVSGLAVRKEFVTTGAFTGEIEDGLSGAVCELLSGLAREVPEGQDIVEIGRGEGESTRWLVRGSEAGNKNRVFSFAAQNEDTDLTIDLGGAESQGILVLRPAADEEVARRWKSKLGLLWINIHGEYEDLKSIFRCWGCHLSLDGRVAVIGCDQRGFARAIKEHLGNLGDFTHERSVDTTMVLRIDQCTHYWLIDMDQQGICRYCGRTRNFRRLMREAAETRAKKVQAAIRKTRAKKK